MLGNDVIKRFLRPAKNQQLILSSFEELNWCNRIDNPIAGTAKTTAEDRLKDAIASLNASQSGGSKILFGKDGTGKGVTYRIIGEPGDGTRYRIAT